MAKSKETMPMAMPENDWAKTISLRFNKESGLDPPEGFQDLKVGETINAEITGEILSISHGQDGSSLEIKMKQVELESPAEEKKEGKTIGETLEKIATKKA